MSALLSNMLYVLNIKHIWNSSLLRRPVQQLQLHKNTYNLEKRQNLKIEFLKIQLEQIWLCFYHSL